MRPGPFDAARLRAGAGDRLAHVFDAFACASARTARAELAGAVNVLKFDGAQVRVVAAIPSMRAPLRPLSANSVVATCSISAMVRDKMKPVIAQSSASVGEAAGQRSGG